MSELDGVKTKKKKSSSSKSQDDKVKKKKSSGEKKKKKKRGDDEATNALAEDEHDLHDPGGHVEEIKPVTNAEAIRATLNFKPTGDHFVIGPDGQIPFGLDRAGFETLEVERIRDAVTQDDLDWLDLGSEIKTVDGRTAVGLASCTSDDGKELMGIALSTHRKALYIECRDWLPEDVKRYSSALMAFLHSADILCVGLDLALTVLAIRRHLNIDSCGVDVCSATPMEAKSPAGTAEALFKSLPGITRLFQYTWKGPDVPPRRPGEEAPPPEEPEVDDDYSAGYGALRAWLALTCAVHTRRWQYVQQARELDTRRVGLQQISFFLDSYHVQARLEALKPRTAVADMAADSFRTDSKGQLDLLNAKFSSKVRVDANQTLKLTLSDGRVVEHASALATKGRHTIIKGNEKGVQVVSVEVQGRASGTLADMMWRVYMRQALSGTIDVHDSDIINEIFWTNTRRGHARRMAKARELLADKTPPPIPEEPEPAPSPADDASPKVAEVAEDKAPEETKEPAEETVEKAKEDEPGSAADEVPSQTGESQMPEEEESQTDLVTRNEPAPAVPIEEAGPPTSHATQRLNPAQRKAHDAICGGELPVCLIQGPPGTGKTSVISAAVQTWLLRNDAPKCIFVCAKNNVASQNIADSLKDTGFEDFRLIVSSDFYIDWHEHRYSLKKQLVISNQLGTKVEPEEIEELMGGVRVVICTLAMLSSHNLMENGFFQSYRPYSLLIDEASQIRSDELPFALDRFKRSLQNVAFFGDNKQLAPYHAAQVRAIKSIFDMAHLQPYTIFLNIQYRLPSRVGDFISTYVYGSNLRSAANTSANRDCVKFVDVPEGEEEKSGTSTINRKEIEVIVALVGKYYQDSSFKILTPYDAQGNAIEAALQTNNLPWKDRVFNVDSFQGQEDDIILISLVKTKQLGFLNELRRSNVMLTRLKKAMIIVTQRMFLDTIAFKTLIGRMAYVFRMLTPDSWIDAEQVLSGEANMPERVVANTEVCASDAANLGQYGLDWNATVINGERAQAKSSKPAWSQDNGPPRPKSDDEESVVEPGRLDFDSAEFEITPIEIETEEEAANRPKTDWAADEQEDGLPALAEQWILDAQARANEARAVEDDEEPAEASKPETPEEIDDGLMAEGEDNVGQGDAEEDASNLPRYPPGLGPADLPPVPPGLANPLTVELTPEEILRNLPPLPRAPYGEQDDLDGDEVRRKPPRLDLIWSVPGEEDDEDDEEQEYSDDSETIAKRRRRAFASGLSWDPDRVPAAVGWEDTVPGRPASAAEDEPSAQSSAAVESNANGNASSSAKKPKQAAASTNGRPQAASGWDDSVPPRGTDEYLAGLWDGTIVYDGPPRANKHVIPGLPSSVKAAASDPTKKAKRRKKKTNIV